MTESDPIQLKYNRALQMLAGDLVTGVLLHASHPGQCAGYITSHLRELIGVRVVALLERLPLSSSTSYTLMSVCPERHAGLFTSQVIDALRRMSEKCSGITIVPKESIEAVIGSASLISVQGNSLIIPLRANEQPVGLLVLLNLSEDKGIPQVISALENLAGVVALIMRNAMLYRTMGKLVEERTCELTEAVQTLATSREAFRSLVENVPGAVYRCQVRYPWQVEHISDGIYPLTGYKAAEFIAQRATLGSVIHPDDLALVETQAEQAIMSHAPYEIEYRMVRADGSIGWVQEKGRAIYDAAGQPLYLDGIILDITERKRMEDALQESMEKFRSVFWLSPEMISVSRLADGVFMEVNEAYEKTTGFSRQETIGKSSVELGLWADKQDRQRIINMMQDKGVVNHLDVNFIRKDGALLPVFFSAKIIKIRNENLLLVMAVDISQRKQMEEEIRRRNEEIERFTYTVSHDLKSPLVTIKSFLGYVEKDLAEGNAKSLQEDMKYIHSAADKMKMLLDELLEISRIGRKVNPPETCRLAELAGEAQAIVAGQIAQRGVTIQVNQGEESLFGDRVRLVEVVQNLVDNAVKFMGDQPRPRVEIGVQQRNGQRVFYVRDNGIGIEPRYQNRLFGLFEKLDPKVEGTGMGLAIIKRIVELHGGTIWVESEGAGKGTTFCFTINGPG